ncbi:hypothetical protein K438DRAFT_1936851 [Mycena galopus ATCC 62051]|nr:hypothetical protein K438DRAFT_1936851 [Mycena galopus ATCC 62051]
MSQGPESRAQHRPEMHRSLRIPEVVSLICSRLNPVANVGAAALAALARTSTVFHDAALDELWKQQTTLMNLIHCMPSDLWEIVHLPGALRILFGPVLKPTRPIVPSDWDRPLIESKNCRWPMEKIQTCIPGDHLLPSLQHLSWGYSSAASLGYSESVLPFIDLFLGPHLKSIVIGQCEGNAHYSLLADLGHNYPALTGVAILPAESTDDDDDDDGATIFLRSLIDSCSISRRRHAGSRRVDPYRRTENPGPPRRRAPPSLLFPQANHGALFPRLREAKIRIESGDILALTEFLRTWNNPALRSFDVDFKGNKGRDLSAPIFSQRVEEFHRILSVHCVPGSLKTFRFHISDDSSFDDVGSFVYPGHCLNSLFGFSNLTDVSIRVLHGFAIDDAVVSDLARAWPYLRELSLATEGHDPTPLVTLRGVQALAQYCDQLRALVMTFDATNVPPSATSEEPQISQRALVSLEVAFSHIAVAFPVARFLSATFVKLKRVKAEYSQYSSKWDEVGVLLPELLEIREEERVRGHNAALHNLASHSGSAPIVL